MADSDGASGARRGSRIRRVLLAVVLMAVGGAAFSWTFHRGLAAVPPPSYEARDDAVVTLSHARNLVEFGFIGVNPSGERIEGFSAPLQFWTAAAAYAIARTDYRTFFRAQTEIGTVVLGALLALVLGGGVLSGAGMWRRYVFAVAAVVSAAWILASSRVFLLWHASGMENVYKCVCLAALLWALDAMLRTAEIRWSAVLVVSAAALSRIDSILAVVCLLAAFVVLWTIRYRDARGAVFTTVSLTPWILYIVWRRWYFGEWIPNTAGAQNISVSLRAARWWTEPQLLWADWSQWAASVTPTLHVFQLALLPALLPFIWRRSTAWSRVVLVLSGVVGCLGHYAVFGPVRLDVARPVTELALYSTAAVPWVLLAVETFAWRHLAVGVVAIACSTWFAVNRPPDRNEIGWSADIFEGVANQVEVIAKQHAIPRPSFANADLGAPSWRKQFNVIDFGLLGSAVTPRVRHVGGYLAELAKPDIIEMHSAWSCLYRDLFTNATFESEYVAVSEQRNEWLNANCADAPMARTGIWLRRAIMKDSGSRERGFLDQFQQTLSPRAVHDELSRCVGVDEARPCGYVGRTLFRFVPELKARGVYREIETMLAADPRLAVEHAYFTSSEDPGWWKALLRVGLEWRRVT